METARITYLGDIRTEATHLRSGNKIITDAPVDNHGKGEAFSPTDLLATSLGTCMVTIMGISAEKHGFTIDGTVIHVTKIMKEDPRRVGEIIVEFEFPKTDYSEKERRLIWHAARTCPVMQSLHPDLVRTIRMNIAEPL